MADDAGAGSVFNRWRIPPAAMALHLCIGQAYALSVFYHPVLNSGEPWIGAHLGRVFTLAMLTLGLSAAMGARLTAQWGTRVVAMMASLFLGSRMLRS